MFKHARIFENDEKTFLLYVVENRLLLLSAKTVRWCIYLSGQDVSAKRKMSYLLSQQNCFENICHLVVLYEGNYDSSFVYMYFAVSRYYSGCVVLGDV